MVRKTVTVPFCLDKEPQCLFPDNFEDDFLTNLFSRMSTEKSPLVASPLNFNSTRAIPIHVQDAQRVHTRHKKERQLRCIMFISIIATFIMALVITMTYSTNDSSIFIEETKDSQVQKYSPGIEFLKLHKLQSLSNPNSYNSNLSKNELKLAIATGNAAIAARRLADLSSNNLKTPSPSSRHQYAVGTSLRADLLALQGIAEIAVTQEIEKSRGNTERFSSFGTFFNSSWISNYTCETTRIVVCPKKISKYRSYDGTCNHPQHIGSAFTPFKRILPPDYADNISAPRAGKFGKPLPSAREVSLKVHSPSPSRNPAFTVMLAVFGQFLDHDITATAISRGINKSSISCCPLKNQSHPECYPVRIGPGDPLYDVSNISCMEFIRSAPAAQCQLGPREQLNQVTAFIDGSVIYGSDKQTANDLREFSSGQLRMQKTADNRFLLPLSLDPNDGCNSKYELSRGRYCFASGDPRANENLHLTTMHLLWARQHNMLTAKLSQINPQWNDEILYQEARRIVGAQLQHITYNEFVPIIIGGYEMKKYNISLMTQGFKVFNPSETDPSIANSFSTASFRFAHTLLPGLMKMTDEEKGTSAWVQLHKMLFNPYSLYNKGGVKNAITSAFSNNIQMTSTHVTSQLTAHLFEDPLNNKSTPCGLDLVSLNIQRGRDHGLPSYLKWREYCGLKRPSSFEGLKDEMDLETLDAIAKLYDDVNDIDLYTGALAEVTSSDGLLGPTFTCLNAQQFKRLQIGDQYWYELGNQPGSFNKEQLKELRLTSLAHIICDTSDDIQQVQLHVMRSVSLENPLLACKDIPRPSLEAWREKN